MPIAITGLDIRPLREITGRTTVEAAAAAGGADSIYTERTGLHVAAATCVALLGERVLGLPR